MSPKTILIVDPSVQHGDFIAHQVLNPHDYLSLVARDSQTAARLANQHQIDLALVDDQLAYLDLLATLHHRQAYLPTILTTTAPPETVNLAAVRLGVRDSLQKPYQVEIARQCIHRVLLETEAHQQWQTLRQQQKLSAKQLDWFQQSFNTLSSLSKSVLVETNHDKLWVRLVEAAIYLTKAEEGMLLIVNQKSGQLKVVATVGVDERWVTIFQLSHENSGASRAIQERRPIMLEGAATQPDAPYPMQTLLYVPIVVNQGVVGLLRVGNRERSYRFGNFDIRLLSQLANYAAMSWESHHLRQQVQQTQTGLSTVMAGLIG